MVRSIIYLSPRKLFMPWYLFALGGALFTAVYYTLSKKYLRTIHPYRLAAGTFLSSAFFLLLFSLIWGIPTIQSDLYLPLLGTVALNIPAMIHLYKSLQSADLSLAVPILSFTPVFTLVTSFVLLHELPTAYGFGGIALIVIGSYILEIRTAKTSLLQPFRELVKHGGTRSMLLVAFLVSITINLDKLVVLRSDPIFGYMIAHFLLGISFVFFVFIGRVKEARRINIIKEGMIKGNMIKELKNVKDVLKNRYIKIICLGLVLALSMVLVNTALSLQIVPYVISLKRTSIPLSVLFGILFFREQHAGSRLVGAAIMLLGMSMLLFV